MNPINPTTQQPTPTPIPGNPLQSQGMPMGGSVMPPETEMATPEQRQELMDILDTTREKMAELQTAKFASENAKEAARVEALKEVFSMMKEAGVDLMSPDSVGQFIQRMKDANPTLAPLFEEALAALLGEDGEDMVDAATTSPNETVPQNLRGPIPPTQGN